MVWFKVDDSLAFHAKAVEAGNAAMGMWVRAGSWCAQQLTDGFVPDHMIVAFGSRTQAKALVDTGLWLREDGGYRFHDWHEYQPTREQVEKERAEARQRMKRRRGSKWESGSPDVRANTERTSVSVRGPRPDPTRPDLSSDELEGGSHVSSGSPEQPPLYSDRCSRHGNVAEPGPCGACADVRKANAARPPLRLVGDTKRCVVHDTTYTRICPGCRADEIAAEETA